MLTDLAQSLTNETKIEGESVEAWNQAIEDSNAMELF
jgi:hypothetical protein